MNFITCYLDFASPHASLAFDALPRVLQGLSHAVEYRPVWLGALRQHHGHEGLAATGAERDWIERHTAWLAHSSGLRLHMPTRYPFDSSPLLRLAVACGGDGRVNRHVAGSVLRHVWRDGLDPLDPARLEALGTALQPRHDPAGHQVEGWLRANTDAAIGQGAFDLPTFALDGKLFCGLDGVSVLRGCLAGDAWFKTARQRDLPASTNDRSGG